MLDIVVLVAMAITAVAFAAGLIVEAGLPLLPVLIGAVALFGVMAASFLKGGRAASAGAGGDDRLGDLEQALEVIDADLQRLDRVEAGVSQLNALHDKVERIDQHIASTPASGAMGMPTDMHDVYERIETVRNEVAEESRAQRQKIVNDLGALEGLIVQMAGGGLSAPARPEPAVAEQPARAAFAAPEPEPLPEPEPVMDPVLFEEPEPEGLAEPEPELPEPAMDRSLFADSQPEEPEQADAEPESTAPEFMPVGEDEIEEVEFDLAADLPAEDPASDQRELAHEAEDVMEETQNDPNAGEASLAAALAAVQPAPEPELEPEPEEVFDEYSYDLAELDDDDLMLDIIREGIEQGRVDLYLQPTVALPDRKVRYFEGLTRIRKGDGEIVMPGDYMPVAKRSALMPLIDNVLLVRAVQILRRLGPDAPIKGVFANISMHSLLDVDYFPELIEFMEENSNLGESLVFEISQAELQGLNEDELAYLDSLVALGFSFCIDNVTDLDHGFDGLSDRNFRFAKISAEMFLAGPDRNAADLKRRLAGEGIELIVEKVEAEDDAARLADLGVELAQGFLFAEPAPANTALSRELSRG